MKNIIKRASAVLFAAVMSVNLMFGSVYSANEAVPAYNEQVRTENNMVIEGNDSFGSMVAAEFQAAQDTQTANNGQNIISVEMTGNIATVEYSAVVDCEIIVGIYDEAGTTMLASGNAAVSQGNNTVNVTVNTDQMPQYYYLKAFLVDKFTMRPVCPVYTNPLYTKDMQEFLAKTTDDFDQEKVYNLDDNKSNNFAVFKDGVEILDIEPTKVEDGVAYFDAVTDQIKGLQKDSIVAYTYNGQLYVNAVALKKTYEENNTSRIFFLNNETAKLEDVFDYVKIDGEADLEKTTVTETENGDDSVKYLGMKVGGESDQSSPEAGFVTDAGEGSANVTFEFGVDKGYQTENEGLSGECSAKISLSFGVSAKLYVTLQEQYVELTMDITSVVNAGFKGKVHGEISLGQYLSIPVCPGVNVGLEPAFIVEAELTGSITIETKSKTGFRCDGQSITDLSTAPESTIDTELQGKFYIGFSLKPKISLLSECLVVASASAQIGVEITISPDLSEASPFVEHDCRSCLAGTLCGVIEVGFELKFFNSDNFKFEIKLFESKTPEFDFHYSDIDGLAWGKCPNKRYATEVHARDSLKNELINAVVYIDGQEYAYAECKDGVFLTSGNHKFKAECYGFVDALRTINVEASALEKNIVELTCYHTGEAAGVCNMSFKGSQSSCIINNGDLYVWGVNGYGQLGNGTASNYDALYPTKIMSDVSYVDVGGSHSACITADGELFTWGYNYRGQLGDGTYVNSKVPVKIMSGVGSVCVRGNSSACVTAEGDLYTWGQNNYGMLGDGTRVNRPLPQKIMEGVDSVSFGNLFGACVTITGDLYTWGCNLWGQLGDGTTTSRNDPQIIMSDVVAVSLGYAHGACITSDGDLYTWGANESGQLGDGTTENSSVPKLIMTNVESVSLGGYHSGCITKDGSVYVWGRNGFGQVGDGTTQNSLVPKKVMDNAASLSLGGNHSGCITNDNELYTWGYNSDGQLGNGTKNNSSVPTKISITVGDAAVSLDAVPSFESDGSVPNDGVYTFTGLLPNEIYNVYSMDRRNCNDPFGWENLLYIDQMISDSSGVLSVKVSTKRENVSPQVFVKAMNGGVIKNAQISVIATSGDSASMSWNAVEGADHYTVYSIKNGVFVKECDTSELSYSAANLVDGKKYGFIVQSWVNGEYSVLDNSDAVFVTIKKEKTINDYILIVNSIPKDRTILTVEELEAIQKVLDHDFGKE